MKKKGLILLTTLMLAGGAFAGIALSSKSAMPVEEAKADGGAIIENVGGKDYRVIYYTIDSAWETSNTFYYTSESNGHCYKYTTNGSNYVLNWFGSGSAGDAEFSEIISDYTAKIYLPTTIQSIRFQSSKKLDSGGWDMQRETDEMAISSNSQAFVLTTNKWSTWPAQTSDAGYQEGTWESKDDFMARFKEVYVTVTSEWQNGISGLNTDYVKVTHTGSDSSTLSRTFKITNAMIDGNNYAKILVSSVSGSTFRLQDKEDAGASGKSVSVTLSVPTAEDQLMILTPKKNDNDEQKAFLIPLEGIPSGDYIFYTPHSDWGSNDVTIKTYDLEGTMVESGTMVDIKTALGGTFGGSEKVLCFQTSAQCYMFDFSTSSKNNDGHKFVLDTGTSWAKQGKTTNWGSTYYDKVTVSKPDTFISITDDALDPSDDTGRVLYNHYNSAWEINGSVAVETTGGKLGKYWSKAWYILSWFEDNDESSSGTWYGFADIPTDVDDFQFVLLSANSYTATKWNDQYQTLIGGKYTVGGKFSVEDDSFAKIYYGSSDTKDEEHKQWMTISYGGAKDGYARTILLQKIFEAIDTCSDNVYNGVGSSTTLNTNFFSHATSTALAASATTRNGTEAFTISHIIESINYRGINGVPTSGTRINIFNNFVSEETGITVIIIAAVSAVSLCALAFFYIKKRKEI